MNTLQNWKITFHQIVLCLINPSLQARLFPSPRIQFLNAGLVILSIYLLSAIPYSIEDSEQPKEPMLKMSIDKKYYDIGNILTVSGIVQHTSGQIPITIMILGPDSNLVHVEQILISKDGTFATQIKVDGPLWRLPGNYTIMTQYGFKHVSAQTTFEFKKQDSMISDVINVVDKQSSQIFNVNYTITGGKVKNITLDSQDLALVIEIKPEKQGNLALQIPRLLIDSTTDSKAEEPFLVFIDGLETSSFREQASNQDYRILEIPFSVDNSKIDIIGTTVVPEFANMSIIIFSLAVTMILIFTMKIKINYKI
ncbi:MAG TPA: hypothetical protein VFA69_07595 [Candidatus Nitrosotalea sp.]|nr:hypothetical protein [Candidatus Nitrosotalea sp.]